MKRKMYLVVGLVSFLAPVFAWGATYNYELVAAPSDIGGLYALCNREGARGFRTLGECQFDGWWIFEKRSDDSNQYAFKYLPAATSADALLAEMNREGASGYMAYVDNVFAGTKYDFFLKPSNGATYSYDLKPSGGTTDYSYSPNLLLATANAEGAQGYAFVGLGALGNVGLAGFARDNTQTDLWSYTFQGGTSAPNLLALVNSQGALGYRWLYVAGDEDVRVLFARNQANPATYSWAATKLPATTTELLAMLNDYGGQGYEYDGWGSYSWFCKTMPLSAPQITSQPVSTTTTAGVGTTLSVKAVNATSYQWQKDGVAIAGATSANLVISNPSSLDSGSYCAVVTGGTSVTSNPVSLTVAPTTLKNTAARLVDISSRTLVSGTGENAQYAGFVITGSAAKQVLIRGSGPALAALGVGNTITDPQVTLYDASNKVITRNDNWDYATVQSVAASVGAFGWTRGSKDAAIVTTLQPGLYSAAVSDTGGGTGVALVEVYEVGSSTAGRLCNLSTRSLVGTGDNVQIAGFVITGAGLKTVLVRAAGPALRSFGLANATPNPVLTVYKDSTPVATNAGWDYNSIQATASAVGAFDWTRGSSDAALLLSLPAGSYTAIVKDANDTTGVGLIEVYDVNR